MLIQNGVSRMTPAKPLYPWEPENIVRIDALLTWAVRDQRALAVARNSAGLHRIEAAAAGIAVQGVSGCGCVAVERIDNIGARIDISRPDQGDVHEMAEALVGLAIREGMTQALAHAQAGTKPSLEEPVRWLMPSLERAGRALTVEVGRCVVVEYVKGVRRTLVRPVFWTPVDTRWSLEHRARAEAAYDLWARQMNWLAVLAGQRFAPIRVAPVLGLVDRKANKSA